METMSINNNNSYEEQKKAFIDQINEFLHDPNIVIISLYVPIFITALTANFLVIFIICKYYFLRSVTNLFVLNLSIADLLVTLVCMPVGILHSFTVVWNYGKILCKFTNYLQCSAVAASIYTITIMSIDRCLAITHPIRFPKFINRKLAIIIISILWIFSLLISLPIFWVSTIENVYLPIFYNHNHTENASDALQFNSTEKFITLSFCKEDWNEQNSIVGKRTSYGYVFFVMIYAIPGFVMVVAYSLIGRTLCAKHLPLSESLTQNLQNNRLIRERHRVAIILFLLTILFTICWLPYHFITLLLDTNSIDVYTSKSKNLISAATYTLLMGHLNSAINPLLYCFMKKNLRRKLLLTFHRHENCPHKVSFRNSGTGEQIIDTSKERTSKMQSSHKKGSR